MADGPECRGAADPCQDLACVGLVDPLTGEILADAADGERVADAGGADAFSNALISPGELREAIEFPDSRSWRARATFLPGGIHAAAPGRRPPPPQTFTPRGPIMGFSMSSRKRLRLALMGIDWPSIASEWITLTYHKMWPGGWQGWKRDLDRFRDRLQRAYAPLGGVWRWEFQRRGAPHVHLVLCWRPGEAPHHDDLRSWVATAWSEVIGEADNAAHTAWGTLTVHVDRHHDDQLGALVGYLCKEMAKVSQMGDGDVGCGRVWGMWGDLPMITLADIELTDEGYSELAQRVAKQGQGWLADNLSGAWPGFVVMGNGREMMAELLDDLPGGVVFVDGSGGVSAPMARVSGKGLVGGR